MKKAGLLLTALMIGTAACTGNINDNSNSKDNVDFGPLKIDKTKSSFTSGQSAESALVDDINAGRQISFKRVTDLFLTQHVMAYGKFDETSAVNKKGDMTVRLNADKNVSDAYKSLIEISAKTRGVDYFKLKPAYEALLLKKSGKDLIYNKDAVTTEDIRLENKMQCYSGTSLNLLVTRSNSTGRDYRAQNYVVIFESGHVLPGRMIKTLNTGWELFGVETTATGEAIQALGQASNLDPSKTRVVDADLFVLSEVLKNSLSVESKAKLMGHILSETSKKYGIPTLPSSAVIEVDQGLLSTEELAPINSSLFSFGVDTTPAGDIARKEATNAWTSKDLADALKEKNTPVKSVMILTRGMMAQNELSVQDQKTIELVCANKGAYVAYMIRVNKKSDDSNSFIKNISEECERMNYDTRAIFELNLSQKMHTIAEAINHLEKTPSNLDLVQSVETDLNSCLQATMEYDEANLRVHCKNISNVEKLMTSRGVDLKKYSFETFLKKITPQTGYFDYNYRKTATQAKCPFSFSPVTSGGVLIECCKTGDGLNQSARDCAPPIVQ